MLHICGVSKTFGEWYQKTNKTAKASLGIDSRTAVTRSWIAAVRTVSRSFMNVADRVL
jgi:hypothetical protein